MKPSTLWRRRRNAVRELQGLQQRVRDAAEGWLDYYRVAVGNHKLNSSPHHHYMTTWHKDAERQTHFMVQGSASKTMQHIGVPH